MHQQQKQQTMTVLYCGHYVIICWIAVTHELTRLSKQQQKKNQKSKHTNIKAGAHFAKTSFISPLFPLFIYSCHFRVLFFHFNDESQFILTEKMKEKTCLPPKMVYATHTHSHIIADFQFRRTICFT